MNIAAVLAVLDVEDLDRNAKHAVLVVACRANQHTRTARLSLGRIAKDMECHYDTARRALDRAVDSGYLTVDRPVGKAPLWTVNLAVSASQPRGFTASTSRSRTATKDKEGERQGSPLPPRAAGDGENPAAANTGGSEHPKTNIIAARLAELCVGVDRRTVTHEATALVTWALSALDWRVVDEIVGYAFEWESRPTLPRALAGPVLQRAREVGVRLAPFGPTRAVA